jgi:hypothetical protein
MFAGCIMVIAVVHGLSIMMGPATLKLLDGWPTLMLGAGILISAFCKLVWDRRYGYSFTRSVVEMVIVGVLCYGIVLGVFLYFTGMMHSGKPWFVLPSLATPVPKP